MSKLKDIVICILVLLAIGVATIGFMSMATDSLEHEQMRYAYGDASLED